MKIKCPNCGAFASLDLLLTHDGARDAILATAKLSGELGVLIIRYVGLFRPEKTELTFNRVAKLINELLPAIQSQRLAFDSKVFDAPIDAWIYAMTEMLSQREKGKLKTPIGNHNYLYRIISQYQPQQSQAQQRHEAETVNNQPTNAPTSQMEAGVMALQGLKR